MTKIIETKRLILREFTINDLTKLQKILSDKDVMLFSVWGPLDEKGTRIFLEKTFESYKKNGYGKWAVIDKEKNKLIGSCGLHNVDIGEGKMQTELGYRLAKNFWGKGLGAEAAKAMCKYGFKALHLREIISCIDKENVASIRVAEKIGMKHWKSGKMFGHECEIYKITDNEWRELNKS